MSMSTPVSVRTKTFADNGLTTWWSARHPARLSAERMPAGILAGRIATEAMHAIRAWANFEVEGRAPTRRGRPYHPLDGSYYPYVPSRYLADLLHNSLCFLADNHEVYRNYEHADGSRLSPAESALAAIVERVPSQPRTEQCAQMIAWCDHVLAPAGWTVEDLHDWAETLRGWTLRMR